MRGRQQITMSDPTLIKWQLAGADCVVFVVETEITVHILLKQQIQQETVWRTEKNVLHFSSQNKLFLKEYRDIFAGNSIPSRLHFFPPITTFNFKG